MRKDIVSDWRNVCTEQDKLLLKEEGGDLSLKLGYEENNDWQLAEATYVREGKGARR